MFFVGIGVRINSFAMAMSNAELVTELQFLKGLLRKEEDKLQCAEATGAGEGTYFSLEDEMARLRKENREFRKRLEKLRLRERELAYDPEVLDKRNAVAAVWKEVAVVRSEVDTLEFVRYRWIKGLKEDRENERSISDIRTHHYEEKVLLREEMRQVAEELKEAEKKDDQLHKRLALMQTHALLNVQEEEVSKLKKKFVEQVETINELRQTADALKVRRMDLMDEKRRLVFKEGRAKAKMERDIANLQSLLLRSEEELTQIFRTKGHLRSK